jgi:hypothetical protein
MPRPRQNPTHVSDHMIVYRRPDPVTVARIIDEYSPEAACERWSSLAAATVTKLGAEGRKILAARKPNRSAMRLCCDCGQLFHSTGASNWVCKPCRAASTAVFS